MNFKPICDFCEKSGICFSLNEEMNKHTSFKIGGPASVFVCPKNENELIALIKAIKENSLPYFVLGKGSNLLVSDKGLSAVVISLNEMQKIEVCGNLITAEAGAKLSTVCVAAKTYALS